MVHLKETEANDLSNGYNAIADDFIKLRSHTGRDIVSSWAANFSKGASILDVGAGHGVPLTEALIKAELTVKAIEASPRMVQAFQARFPHIEIACEAAETSLYFNQKFEGILSVGLVFLLSEQAQRDLIKRLSGALKPGGRLLFSAPCEIGEWEDVLTHQPSRSLGREAYLGILKEAGLNFVTHHIDAGGSYYYEAERACSDMTV